MSFKSIFSREKAPQSTSLPQVPCIRDMIEDIETCPKNDPVLVFAQLLSRRGSRKSSLDSDISEAISASPGPANFSRRLSSSDSDLLPSSQQDTLPSSFLDIPTSYGLTLSSSGDQSTATSALDQTDAIYFKLRQFISISEQTQENVEEIEEKLRNFEQHNQEFLDKLKGNR